MLLFENVFSYIYVRKISNEARSKLSDQIFLRHRTFSLSRHQDHDDWLPTIHAGVFLVILLAAPMSSICYFLGNCTLLWLDLTYSWRESRFSNCQFRVKFFVIKILEWYCIWDIVVVIMVWVDRQMFPIWFFNEPILEDACRRSKYKIKCKIKCVY